MTITLKISIFQTTLP